MEMPFDKENLHSAIHQMNLNINSKERAAVNNYRFRLYQFSDRLVDESHLPSVFTAYPKLEKLAKELKELILEFPMLNGREDF